MSSQPRFLNIRHENRASSVAFHSAVLEGVAPEVIEKGVGLWAIDALKEDIVERMNGKGLSSKDRLDMQVARQLQSMGVERFQVGVLKDGRMHLEAMDIQGVIYQSAKLRGLNAGGADIHIRPVEANGYSVSVVDDLRPEGLAAMKQQGYTPSVVVRTSPNNYQAWMRHGEALDRETLHSVGKALAVKFGADVEGATAGHMGRLAGTTNRKEKHRQPDGRYPWVVVTEATGKVYDAAPQFIAAVKHSMVLEAQAKQAENQAKYAAYQRPKTERPLKTIEDFRRDARYGGTNHKSDYAYAIYATGKGVPPSEIAAAIRTRDLSHKEKGYVEYAIKRAEEKVGVPQKSAGMEMR